MLAQAEIQARRMSHVKGRDEIRVLLALPLDARLLGHDGQNAIAVWRSELKRMPGVVPIQSAP